MSKELVKTSTVQTTSYSDKEVLNFLLRNANMSIDSVAESMKKAELQTILNEHPYPITQGKDGRWRTYVKNDDGSRRQIAKATQEKIHTALYEHYKKTTYQDFTLEMLYQEWLEYKKLKCASSTYLRRIDSDWRNYYLTTDIVRIPIKKIRKIDYDVWAHQLIEKVAHKKKQYYNISMLMRQMCDYAVDLGIISENIFRQVNIDGRMVFIPEKKKSSETQVFSKEELELLYEIAWDDFKSGHNTVHKLCPLAVMFQFQTGVRIAELCALRYEDIQGDEIYVQRMYRFEDKEMIDYLKGHNEGRFVVLTPMAKELISTAQKYQREHGLPTEGYIFSVNDDPLSYYSVRKIYARFCDKIGTINKSSHKSRKTYISALVAGGVNIKEVARLCGHADTRTTYNSYVFDRCTKEERISLIENALN